MNPISLTLLESTFPGWPEFTAPSPLHMLLLTLGAPGLVFLLAMALGVGVARREQAARNQQVAGLVDAPVRREALESRHEDVVRHDDHELSPAGGAHVAPRHAELD
ncbi:hypothetical protein GCM10027030_00160 [Luteococcus sediminum]